MKAVFFDFDGVLTTDKTGSTSICNYVSHKTGISVESFSNAYRKYNKRLQYGELTHRDIWDDVCKALDTSIPYEVLFESFIFTPIDTAMIQLIKNLVSAGYKTGLITDNKKDRIDAIIAYYNWYALFDTIIVSSEVGSGKEDADIFHMALESSNVDPKDCIFIDNTQRNLTIPAQIGFYTILYDDEKRPFETLVSGLKNLGVL